MTFALFGLIFGGAFGSMPPDSVGRAVRLHPIVFEYYQKLGDRTLDPVLEQALGHSDPFAKLEVIAQFYDRILPSDREYLHRIGFDAKREFHAIPAVHGLATPETVRILGEHKRTYWIELNEQLEYLMDETTTTTNATRVWDSYITDSTGRIEKPIDGSGVTVAVVDSGIDAGHPDLDYGQKVILNYKSDTDGAYTSVENSDTSSGHGTHCAGTIGGTGDASAGARRGMAPGCDIIGISTGEAVAILNALGALEWVYDHSRPNANPYNIRVVSNSWGTNAAYNPEDAIVKVSEKLCYDNNVLVVFAAGNEGEADHDGSTVTTNPYSLPPSVVSIAACLKTPDGLAAFSSRGSAADNFTWPDVGAPGFKIWATEARKTLITASVKMSNQEDAIDGYYMAISGTSMATPHVAGLAALLWQAAPSLRVSDIHDDYSGKGDYKNEAYWNSSNTLIHEIELILKLTARYMAPDDVPMNSETDNGIPDNHSIGINGQKYDYAQGYGFIDAEKAVALALTLETLRFTNSQATVWDALYSYNSIITSKKKMEDTNVLKTEWTGEWSYLNDGRESTVFTNHPKNVYIPNETKMLILDLSFDPVNIPERQAGTLALTIDYNRDGTSDWQSQLSFTGSLNGIKHDEITMSGAMGESTNQLWTFNVIGEVLSWPIEDIITTGNPLLVGEKDFREGLIEYKVSVQLVLDVSANATTAVEFGDLHANIGWLGFGNPTSDYADGTIELNGNLFDLGNAKMPEERPPEGPAAKKRSFWPIILLILLMLLAAWWYLRRRAGKPFLPSKLSGSSTPQPQPESVNEAEPGVAETTETPRNAERGKPEP